MLRTIAPLAALALVLQAAHAADIVIEDVTVLSPERAQPLRSQWVHIRDERIAQISPRPITVAKAERVRGTGKFLTPGLMDSHVHVSDAIGLPPGPPTPELAALAEAFFRQQPRSYLYFGVTQVLDVANVPAGIAAFESQPVRPDLFRCGATTVLDGYPTVFIDKPQRYELLPDYIYEPANADKHPLPAGANADEHTPEAIVDRIAASGAVCVKIFIEDGFGPATDWPIASKETLQRVRAAATKRRLPLLAHANALEMQRIALDAKVDVLTHGLWNWDEASGEPGIPEPIATHLKRIHASGTSYQPTLRVLAGTADLFRADTLQDPAYAKVVPPALLEWYATDAGQWFKEIMKQAYGNPSSEKIASSQLQIGEPGMRAVKYLYDLGHPLLLGSDTPSAPTYGNQPGYDTYREMRLMATAGIPALDVFRAATINNARQFGLDKDYGTVSAGKVANLLLLDGNPLESMRAWSQIDKIILRGKIIERETLAADAK